MNFTPGARMTLGHNLGRDARNRDYNVEFTFYGLNNWTRSNGLVAFIPDSIFTERSRVPLLGFSETNRQSFTYANDFNSYELNVRINRRLGRDRIELNRQGEWIRNCTPNNLPSFFAGLRVVTLNESFGYFSSSFDGLTTGRYTISTHNDLVGLQFGTDWFFQHAKWRAGVRGKAGGFINFADQYSQVTITSPLGSLPARNEGANTNNGAFVGELNFMGAYQFRKNMALRASFDMMWINQVALAPNQLTFETPAVTRVNIGGAPFFEGGSVGLEMFW
jgi:hypothetical protein